MATIEDRVRSIVAALPADASVTLTARTLSSWLEESAGDVSTMVEADSAPSWRALLWTVPDDTRLGIAELCEALGKSRAWIYRRTSATGSRHGYGAAPDRIPHAKVAGQLVFIASEIRSWLRDRERAA